MKHKRRSTQRQRELCAHISAAAQAGQARAHEHVVIGPRGDARPALRLILRADGDVLIDWFLEPRRGNVRQYRALDPETRQPILDAHGAAVGGGVHAIFAAAARVAPKYAGTRHLG